MEEVEETRKTIKHFSAKKRRKKFSGKKKRGSRASS